MEHTISIRLESLEVCIFSFYDRAALENTLNILCTALSSTNRGIACHSLGGYSHRFVLWSAT